MTNPFSGSGFTPSPGVSAPQGGGFARNPNGDAPAPEQSAGTNPFARNPNADTSAGPVQQGGGFARNPNMGGSPAPAGDASPFARDPNVAPDPSRGGWRLGTRSVPRTDLGPREGAWVAGRKPVTLLSGRVTTDIPGEPVYPDPGQIRDFEVRRNGYGHYLLPDPVSGSPSSFPRATTIAKGVRGADDGSLGDWKDRMLIFGLAQNPDLVEGLDADLIGTEQEFKLKSACRQIAESARVSAGAADGREFGTALHAWTEAIDHGKRTFADVPDEMKRHVASYMTMLADNGIEVVPEYVERIVYCPLTGAVGTLDRIYRLEDGRLIIGDLKTSSNIDYAWADIVAQLAQYANASHMLSEDGTHWEPMPEVDPNLGVVASVPHTPKDRGIHCDLYPVNLTQGKYLLELAMAVREAGAARSRHGYRYSPSVQEYTADEALERMIAGQTAPVSHPSRPVEDTGAVTAAAQRAEADAAEAAEQAMSAPTYGPDMTDPRVADAVQSIDATKDADDIADLWQQWWPEELVQYARMAMEKAIARAETNAKRQATRARNKAKKEASAR